MQRSVFRLNLLHLIPAAAVAVLLATTPQPCRAASDTGTVYVMNNQPARNTILVYHRDSAGLLRYLASYATGGQGIGTGADPLGSQNSLVLSDDQRLLVNVNAGSNSVSVFLAFGDQLRLLDVAPSGGVMPVSVAVRRGFVYVVNAGGTPNISGFRFDPNTAKLIPLPGSTQNLPGGAAASPAQISFRPDGSVLMVTEKGTNLVDTFTLANGIANPGVSFPSSGTGPFGFAFGPAQTAVVSNASGGAVDASTVASYRLTADGNLNVVTPALTDTQTAACWLLVTSNGKIAYVANSASATVSSYTLSNGGELGLLNVSAATTPANSTPTDMAFSADGRFLYVRDGGNDAIDIFRVELDSSLTPLAIAPGLPPGAQGIAAR